MNISVIWAVLFLVACAGIYWILALRTIRHRESIKRQRSGYTVDNFLREYVGEEVPEQILQRTYNDFWQLTRLPVLRRDTIDETLGVLPEDLDRTVDHMLQSMHISEADKIRLVSSLRIRTVDDYVHLVHEASKNKS